MKRLFLLLILLTPAGALAGNGLMPMPKLQFFSNQGLPLAGGKIYTCQPGTICGPGTQSPKATFTDLAGLVQNSNPVQLDSAGRASLWLSGYYKVSLYDVNGNLIYDADNISGLIGPAVGGNTPQFFSAASSPVTQDLRGFTEFIAVKTDFSANPLTLIDTTGNTFLGGLTAYILTVGGESVHLVLQSGVWYKI